MLPNLVIYAFEPTEGIFAALRIAISPIRNLLYAKKEVLSRVCRTCVEP